MSTGKFIERIFLFLQDPIKQCESYYLTASKGLIAVGYILAFGLQQGDCYDNLKTMAVGILVVLLIELLNNGLFTILLVLRRDMLLIYLTVFIVIEYIFSTVWWIYTQIFLFSEECDCKEDWPHIYYLCLYWIIECYVMIFIDIFAIFLQCCKTAQGFERIEENEQPHIDSFQAQAFKRWFMLHRRFKASQINN